MAVQMSVTLRGDVQTRKILDNLIALNANFEPILRRCATTLRRSVDKNFREGGRPEKWPDRWSALESVFPNLKGKKVLRVSGGGLRQRSVQDAVVTITPTTLTYGNNLSYAALQQFGGPSKIQVPEDKIRHTKSNGKIGSAGTPYVLMKGDNGFFAKKLDGDGSFTINVRPRPFMMIQDEDIVEIRKVFQKAMIAAMRNQPQERGE